MGPIKILQESIGEFIILEYKKYFWGKPYSMEVTKLKINAFNYKNITNLYRKIASESQYYFFHM